MHVDAKGFDCRAHPTSVLAIPAAYDRSVSTFPAFVVDQGPDGYQRRIEQRTVDSLTPGDVVVSVEYSAVNYKDGLASVANGNVAQRWPLIPGIDLAGVVVESTDSSVSVGQLVLAHGYTIGMSNDGGFAAFARVPAEWIVPIPDSLSTRDAMILGTAGFTAARSVESLQHGGVRPSDGPILVTGATGGVASIAVLLLAIAGYEVVAISGKSDAHDWLSGLGAKRVVPRTEFMAEDPRPLLSAQWAGAVDVVGGDMLAQVLRGVKRAGVVAASGLTGGASLNTTVHPFILRGVTLVGIDSANTPIETRIEIWRRLAASVEGKSLAPLVFGEVTLSELPEALDRVLAGGVRGRTLVRPAL